jgi:hypothetical protein
MHIEPRNNYFIVPMPIILIERRTGRLELDVQYPRNIRYFNFASSFLASAAEALLEMVVPFDGKPTPLKGAISPRLVAGLTFVGQVRAD